MYWEDLHIYFLVTFHTVSTIAFKGGFICPSLCLRVLHPFFWSFSGQIECICRRLQCILHKERVVLSLFFDWIFLMHARFFRRSPTHFGSIEHLIWHFFFFSNLVPWTECSSGVFILSTYKKETYYNISLCSSHWKLNLMLSTAIMLLHVAIVCCNDTYWLLSFKACIFLGMYTEKQLRCSKYCTSWMQCKSI